MQDLELEGNGGGHQARMMGNPLCETLRIREGGLDADELLQGETERERQLEPNHCRRRRGPGGKLQVLAT